MKSIAILLAVAAALLAGCGERKPAAPAQTAAPKHEHKPPHHGTAVVLGNEEYHVELVLDSVTGRMQAYVLDGELESFVRIPASAFEIIARLPGKTLLFNAVANNATGEKIGDTSQFQAEADWLKETTNFDAVIKEMVVRGNRYQNVQFNFPKGNDTGEKK